MSPPALPRLVQPLRALLIFYGVELALIVARYLLSHLGMESGRTFDQAFSTVIDVGACAFVGWLWQVRRGEPGAHLFTTAFVLTAVEVALDLSAFAWEAHPFGPRALFLLPVAVTFGAQLAVFLSLRWLAAAAGVRARNLELAIFALLALKVAQMVVSIAFLPQIIQHSAPGSMRAVFTAMALGRLALFVILRSLLIVYVLRLASAVEAGATLDGATPPLDDVEPSAPGREGLVVGILWLAGGVIVTVGSYTTAVGGYGSGRYVVAWGAIAFGIVRIVRALR
jgi:hypothetical protein